MLMINNKVACTPFETTQTKVDVRGGLPVIRQKQELTKLKVVYGAWSNEMKSTDLTPGTVVWVRGETCKHQFAREVYEIEDGKPFILIPRDLIVAIGE